MGSTFFTDSVDDARILLDPEVFPADFLGEKMLIIVFKSEG